MKEKLVPLIQGPSDTKELHMSRWLNEIRKPESLLAPDLLAFSIQVPQQGDDCRNSGISVLNVWITLFSPLRSSPPHPSFINQVLVHFLVVVLVFGFVTGTDYICTIGDLIQQSPFV